MKTLLRRAAATGVPLASLVKVLVSFATTVPLENVHPLQSGILRLKHPSERRPGLPREAPCIFWPRFVAETVVKHRVAGRHDQQARVSRLFHRQGSGVKELHGPGVDAG